MKPMLAASKPVKPDQLRYPVLVSPKFDGVRALVKGGVVLSRSLKPIPNRAIQGTFGLKRLEGLDGELIWREPTAPDAYRRTVSGVMAEEGWPEVEYFAFDMWNMNVPFVERDFHLQTRVLPVSGNLTLRFVQHTHVGTAAELEALEAKVLAQGYEGLIVRDPESPYKYGRSTLREGYLLKVKRFLDSEMRITGVEEEMENTNVAKRNALGRTERSSHQAGLVGKGRAGTLVGVDIHSGVEVRLGTGMDDPDKDFYWENRAKVIGGIIKYKYFPLGGKDKQRHPVYLGPREEWDL